MTVDEAQTYFVSKIGVLAHNAGKQKENCKPLVLGGAYWKVKGSVRAHKKQGGEVHHMPSVAALDGHKALPNSLPTVTSGRGPAIWMEKPDHLQTKSRKSKVHRD